MEVARSDTVALGIAAIVLTAMVVALIAHRRNIL
jgi:hypothetical protein